MCGITSILKRINLCVIDTCMKGASMDGGGGGGQKDFMNGFSTGNRREGDLKKIKDSQKFPQALNCKLNPCLTILGP